MNNAIKGVNCIIKRLSPKKIRQTGIEYYCANCVTQGAVCPLSHPVLGATVVYSQLNLDSFSKQILLQACVAVLTSPIGSNYLRGCSEVCVYELDELDNSCFTVAFASKKLDYREILSDIDKCDEISGSAIAFNRHCDQVADNNVETVFRLL